jgi:hypothetical protein
MSRRRSRPPRAALAWGLAAFVGLHLAFFVAVPHWHPDDEYTARLKALRALVANHPDAPLLVMVGSSRTALAFAPEILTPRQTPSGERPVAFNFSHIQAGPVMNLLEVRRLLAAGVRPKWLVVEIMPPFLAREWRATYLGGCTADELPLARRYAGGAWLGPFLRARVAPWHDDRGDLLRRLAPGWVAAEGGRPLAIGPCGGWGELHADCPTEQRRQATRRDRECFGPDLADFRVSESADGATRELLALCRSEGIDVALLMAPEGEEFRGWYSPAARDRLDGYCAGLRRDFGVPVVDARDWLPTVDFTDAHHVLIAGAIKFTLRLDQEALRPLTEGRLAAAR